MMKRTRKATEQRRIEIADAALRIVGQRGVEGVTVAGIAEAIGISGPALYKHYPSRAEILEAAMDLLLQRVISWMDSATNPNALERLRELVSSHASTMAMNYEGVVAPLFEFAASGPRSHLSSQLSLRLRAVLQRFLDILAEGQTQGTIRRDIDIEVMAWRLMGLTWIENLAMVEGMEEFVTSGISARTLEAILGEIAA